MLIPNPDLYFWNFDPKIQSWANVGPKVQSCLFCLKIGTNGILRMLILIPILVFWISNPNLLFGKIWAKKVKVVRFNWKLAHMVSWKCRFRSRLRVMKFRPQNLFLGKFGRKSQGCPFFLKIGTHGILTMLILIPTLVYWISNPKSIFGQIWAEKVKAVCFV